MVHAGQTTILPRLLASPIPRPIEAALNRILGIREIEATYGALRAMGGDQPLPERLLQHLEITHRVSDKDLDHVPRKGAAVLVVNHPFGILEGAALTSILSRIRSDARILANGVLTAIPELRDMLIPVDPLGGAGAARGG